MAYRSCRTVDGIELDNPAPPIDYRRAVDSSRIADYMGSAGSRLAADCMAAAVVPMLVADWEADIHIGEVLLG